MTNPWDGRDWEKPKYRKDDRIDFSQCPLALKYPRRKLWHEAAPLKAHRPNREPAKRIDPAGDLYSLASRRAVVHEGERGLSAAADGSKGLDDLDGAA